MTTPHANVSPVAPAAPKMPSLKIGQVFFKGVIRSSRQVQSKDGTFYVTILMLPAASLYEHPSVVEVSSTNRLGNKDDEFQGIFNVKGYGRSYDSKPDPRTGEIYKIQTATHSFIYAED